MRCERETVPDVVPVLAFDVLDLVEWVIDEPLTDWQKRLVIDLYGGGEPNDLRRLR